jgi:hypothetical protein
MFCILFSFSLPSSFALTESVNLFGEINSVDLILNDIWIEPENPSTGEAVSVHGSVYNAGVIPSGEASDAVTVGYIVNGELIEINLLENILPGIENGIVISSGPIFDAIPGNYVVTVIINYHDTLSHLRDNPNNNIVQKQFQILTDVPSFVTYDIYQKYDSKTNKQQITIQGKLTNVFQEKLKNQKIILSIGDSQEELTTDVNGEFSFITSIPFTNKPTKTTVQIEKNVPSSNFSQIFPLKLDNKQSALAIHTSSFSTNFKNSPLTIVIFQDSYDNLFKKISTDKLDEQSVMVDDLFLTVLPANHEYIIEVYLGGMVVDAFQNYFIGENVFNREILISESSEIQFRVINEFGEPQNNVNVNNWIYSATTNENGVTDWIDVLPTFTDNVPYTAKATLPDGKVVWSEPFLIEEGEKKVIQIIQEANNE